MKFFGSFWHFQSGHSDVTSDTNINNEYQQIIIESSPSQNPLDIAIKEIMDTNSGMWPIAQLANCKQTADFLENVNKQTF